MSISQEHRTHLLIEKWQSEVKDLEREMAKLDAELQQKKAKLEALNNQINATKLSDSY